MDDEDEIVDKAIYQNLEKYFIDFLLHPAFIGQVESLIHNRLGNEVSRNRDDIDHLASELYRLCSKIDESGYMIHKIYDDDGKLNDVELIRKYSDY